MEKKRLDEKLLEAEYRCKIRQENIAIPIYNELCLNPSITPQDRMVFIKSYVKYIPDQAREILIRLRDIIPYSGGKALDNLLKLLQNLALSPEIEEHERSCIAATLYNQGYINICYDCFAAIAKDKTVSASYRIDACKFLLNSTQENIITAKDIIKTIINDLSITSIKRYEIITTFNSVSGIRMFINESKMRIPRDEEFVYQLQSSFFYNEANGIRERILSGQHLLQMESDIISEDEKKRVGDVLFDITQNTILDENTRADAADVVFRLGTKEMIEKARSFILELGFSAVDKKSINMLDRIKTVYSNSQNIHDQSVEESIRTFIELMMEDTSIRMQSYDSVHTQIGNAVRTRKLTPEQSHKAYKALHRIKIDTATFTSYKVTIAEILIHVWLRIERYDEDTKQTLETRLIEELVDMGETCSSGHSGRIINVLSGVEDKVISISFESQIASNIVGRINAKIKNIKDEAIKSSIELGALPDASKDDRRLYTEFVTTTLAELHKELYEEFVGGKYINDKDFEEYFKKGIKVFSC